jgi:hypothetical protein
MIIIRVHKELAWIVPLIRRLVRFVFVEVLEWETYFQI